MAKILPIIITPNKILREKSKDINPEDLKKAEMNELLLNMEKTMLQEDGLGLAAPQIGKNINIFVINNKGKTLYIINPKITKRSWAKETDQEGCLSIPNTYGDVIRHKKINITYINEKGKKQKINASNLLARIIQHEYDHLNGVLFTDKAKNIIVKAD
jgi:peptide deformylase